PLLQQDGMQPVRAVLLRPALKYYQSFIQKRRMAPGLRDALVNNYYRVAQITRLMGDGPECLAASQEALLLLDQLLQAHPSDPHYLYGQALVYMEIAGQQRATGALVASLQSEQQVRDILERLVQAEPTVPRYQELLAMNYGNIYSVQHERGEL